MTAIPLWLRIVAPAALLAAVMSGAKIYLAHVDRSARAEQQQADRAEIEKVEREKVIADLKHARATEQARADITKDKDDDYSVQLAEARARAAAYAARMRAQADQPVGERADLSGVSDGAPIDLGAGAHTDISFADLDICTENTVRLQNARDWLREQQEMAQ